MVTIACSADQTAQYPERETISGKLREFRHHVEPVEKPDGQILHSVLRLVMVDGRNIPLVVGARSNVAKLNLKQGSHIQLTGKYETISGRPLFVAEDIQVDGKKFTLPRAEPKKEDANGQADTGSNTSKPETSRDEGQPGPSTNSNGVSQKN